MGLETRRIWVDGALVPWADANLHVLSQSASRGSMAFDVMSAHWGARGPAIFGLREHCERFLRTQALVEMRPGLDLDALLAAVSETVRANPGCELIKLSAYHADVALDVLPKTPEPSIAIAAFSLEDVLGTAPGERRPARLQIADCRKMPDWVMSPQAKVAAGYQYTSVAKARARREGFDDVLLLDQHGDVAESSTMSFMLAEGGALYTAPTDSVLASITRQAVLDVAADEGIAVKIERVPRASLDSADEAFLCGTSVNVWPVARLDARELEAPGPISTRLADRVKRVLAGDDPLSAQWLQAL